MHVDQQFYSHTIQKKMADQFTRGIGMFTLLSVYRVRIAPFLFLFLINNVNASECDNWQSNHPEWIWCDSFESDTTLTSRYEDVSTNGMGRTTSDSFDGQASLQQSYTENQVSAGWVIKVKPEGYPDHIFFRWYHKFEDDFTIFPPKMARAGFRNRNTWQTVFMVHSWISGNNPTLDVVANNSSQGPWLPVGKASHDLSQSLGKWTSYEVEIKLNDPGSQNGQYRLWIDNTLSIERLNVDLIGSTNDKINEVMLDTYWNGGSPAALSRLFDNFIISTERIGMYNSPPLPPSNLLLTNPGN